MKVGLSVESRPFSGKLAFQWKVGLEESIGLSVESRPGGEYRSFSGE